MQSLHWSKFGIHETRSNISQFSQMERTTDEEQHITIYFFYKTTTYNLGQSNFSIQ